MQAEALLSVVEESYPDAQIEFVDYRVKKHERASSLHFLGFKPKRGDTVSGYIEKVKLFFTYRKAKKLYRTVPGSIQPKKSMLCNMI